MSAMSDLLWRLPPTVYLAIQQTFRSGNRLLSLFSILGITLSVALAAGLEMASRAVQREIARTEDVLRGTGDLRISAPRGGIPEHLLADLRAIDGVEAASPMILERIWMPGGLRVQIVGLDFFAERKIHNYSLTDGRLEVRDPLRLVSQPDSIVLSRSLMERLGIDVGDTLRVGSIAGPRSVTVRGALAGGGIADAFGGEVAAMDVFMLQALVDRQPSFDAIDIVVAGDSDVVAVQEELSRTVRGVASIETRSSRNWVSELAAFLRRGVLVVAVLGGLAACLVAFTTMSMSIDRRLRELAVLQLAGLRPSGVRSIVLTESVVSGLIAVAAGLPIALVSARSFLGFFSDVSYVAGAEAADHADIAMSTVVVGVSVGLVSSLMATAPPTWRAGRTRPLDVFARDSGNQSGERVRWLWVTVAALVWALAAVLPNLSPLGRMLLIATASLGAVSALLARALPSIAHGLRRVLDRLVPRVGDLFCTPLATRPMRTAGTATAVAALVATTMAGLVLIDSVTGSVDEWQATRFGDGARITAGDPLQLARENLSSRTVELIGSTPGLAAMAPKKTAPSRYRGKEILVVGSRLRTVHEHAALPIVRGNARAFLAATETGAVGVTDVFAEQFDVDLGDTIAIETPRGLKQLVVAAVLRDYSIGGIVEMPLDHFETIWPDVAYRSVAVWAKHDLETLLEDIRERASEEQALTFLHGQRLRRYGSDLFRSFSSLFYAMGSLAAFLGALGVANLLTASVLDRRRELVALRVAGLSKGQLVAVVIGDGVCLAILACLAGGVLAVVWAGPLEGVLGSMFSWSVAWRIDAAKIAVVIAATCAVAALSSLYPALRAARSLELYLPEFGD